MGHICCFTGYRPHRFGFAPDGLRPEHVQEALGAQIHRLVTEGYHTFITGMCVGVDLWAAEEVLALQQEYPHIRLIAAIPFEGQEATWPQVARRQYRRVRDACQQVVVLSDEPGNRDAYLQRNRWMVDKSDTVLAVFDAFTGRESRSGTASTVRYARRQLRRLVFIHPSTLRVTEETIQQIQFDLE